MGTKSYTDSFASTRIVISQDVLVLYIVQGNDLQIVIDNVVNIEKEMMYDVLVLLSAKKNDLIPELEKKQVNYLIVNDDDLQAKLKQGFNYGLNHGYKYMIQFDDDNQYNWKEMNLLHQKALRGICDVVIGNRTGNPSFEISKANKKIVSSLNSKANLQIEDALCFFRLFSDSAIKVYLSESFISYDPASYVYLKNKADMKFAFQQVSIRKDNISWENERVEQGSFATKQATKIFFGNVK